MEIRISDMIAKLREVKQKEYNDEVNGYGRRPVEVVDSVAWVIRELLEGEDRDALYAEVIHFYPDYEGD